ncbi:MAG: CDP-diacylglycerol--glycerol-3-phosphate 3-phosphatidyltransferase [Verrucomicrobiota bacterium]|jgi:CDP-diacylglycerol--glycerol-3-phosphate 3-phosphatidyltransferase
MLKQLPNIITFSRIGVLIALVWLVLQDWTGAATLAFFCILYGSISDFLDGYIARRYGYITNFGKIMDATVDKVMTLGAFALLLYFALLPPLWFTVPVYLLMFIREMGITVLRMVATRRGVVLAAESSGKRKTIWQVTGICVLFAVPMVERDWAHWLGEDLSFFGLYVWINGYIYFLLAAWLTVSSGWKYLSKYGWVFLPRKGRSA